MELACRCRALEDVVSSSLSFRGSRLGMSAFLDHVSAQHGVFGCTLPRLDHTEGMIRLHC